MPTPPTEARPTHELTRLLTVIVFLAFPAVTIYFLGWVAPAIVTRAESTAGFRTYVGEVFGNAPTAGRVFVGRAR